MLSNPPPGERRPHPLEQRPAPPPPPPGGPGQEPRRRVMMQIPSVRPRVTYVLLALNIAVFILRALSPEIDRDLFLWGANNSVLVLQQGEYHRLVSAMFLHASIYGQGGAFNFQNSLHLIFNMYILYAVGMSLERLFGHARFALVYLLGGLGGSVLSTVLGGPNAYSVGASGAVFAILAAEFVYLYQHRKLMGEAATRQMRNLIWLAAINLAFGAFTSLGVTSLRIDNWGHIGGILGGLSLTRLVGPVYVPRRHPDQPEVLVAQDVNPLERRSWAIFVYVCALVGILAVASIAVRGG